jgi:uroporphyrinogen-III synthase
MGAGTRALFAVTDSLALTGVLLRILGAAQVIVRGPKPTAVLRSRKVRIDRAAGNPFTTHEVLAEMHGTPLRGKHVVVQRYGETNRELRAALASEGAGVIEIVTYRWALPRDTSPLLRLIDALARDEIDLVAFTSASQASNSQRRKLARHLERDEEKWKPVFRPQPVSTFVNASFPPFRRGRAGTLGSRPVGFLAAETSL